MTELDKAERDARSPPEAAVATGPVERCADCGEPLGGKFCSACGQENRDLDQLTVVHLVRDWLGDVFGFDSRLWRTLVPLVRRPGLLTREYLAGRRARYVPPLRLFVFLSLFAFLVLGFTGIELNFGLTQNGEEVVSSEPEPADESASDQTPVRLDPAEIRHDLLDRLPQVMFLLVPVFAFYVWLLHRRRQPYYLPHLVFALHVHSFGFLVWAAVRLIDLPFPTAYRPGTLLLVLTLAVYLYLAQRRVYGGGRLANALRTLVLGVAQNVSFLVALLLLLTVTVYLS